MARPMIYPMGEMEVGDITSMPAPDRATAKKTSRNVSQFGIRNGRAFKCRTIDGVTFITRWM
jgi:hypothetical protein